MRRRWTRLGVWAAALAGCCLFAGPVAAREKPAPDTAALVEAGKAGRIQECAEGFGRLFAKAIKDGDLVHQMALEDALEEALAGHTFGLGATVWQKYATALDGLLAQLADVGTRHPLAHGLALERCYVATHLGQAEGLELALKVLDRDRRGFGKSEFPLLAAKYAEGLVKLAEGKAGAASAILRGPLLLARRVGFEYLACHVALEWVVCTATEDASQGEYVLDDFGAWYLDPSRSALRGASNGWVTARMRALPGELPAYWQSLVEAAPSAGGSAGGAGGAGGNAVLPGARTRVAEVLDRAKRSTVLAEVTRQEDDFEIRFPFERAHRLHADPNKGVGIDHNAEFGITLAIGHAGVRLAMLDLVGNKGQPGGASTPKPFQPLFELAPGETWTLKADGTVTIK